MFFNFIIIGLSLGMVYGLVAFGISFIYRGIDVVHFAQGEIFMLAAFVGLVALKLHEGSVPYWLALIVTSIFIGILGVVIERLFYRRLTEGGGGYTVAGMGIIICGFGMSMVLMGIAFIIWGAESKGYPVEFGPAIFLGEIFLPRTYIWIAAVGLVIMIGLSFFLYKTKLGLAARAVAFNRQTAYLMGVNVPLMISLIFGIGCAVSGAAGVLIAPILFAQIQMGYVMMLKAFAAAVVGGFGSLPGAIIGGLMVGLFETLCAGYLWDEYRDIYAFFLMLVVLMIRPSGMLGINVKVKA